MLVHLKFTQQNTNMPVSNPPTILFGTMAQHAQSTTVIIVATSTFVDIGSGFTSGDGTGFVFQNSHELKCTEPADYMLNWNVSLQLAQGANNNMLGGISINGGIKVLTTAHGFIAASNDLINVSGTGFLTVAFDDLITISLANISSTNNFTVEHAAITIFKIQ